MNHLLSISCESAKGNGPSTIIKGAVFALIFALGTGSAAVTAKSPPCTAAHAQAQIDAGRYDLALREFSCVIDADPTGVEGYRGRIEAELLLGRFSDFDVALGEDPESRLASRGHQEKTQLRTVAPNDHAAGVRRRRNDDFAAVRWRNLVGHRYRIRSRTRAGLVSV